MSGIPSAFSEGIGINWRQRRQGPTPTVVSTGTGLRMRDQLFGWGAYWPWISPESLKLATSRS